MKKILNIIILFAAVVFCGCSDFDDSELRGRIDGYKNRIEALKAKAETLGKQLADLSYLTNGNVITTVSQDADGKYVVTYKDNKDVEHTVVLATMDDIVDVPIIGVKLDENGVYYWTKCIDGEITWLTDDDGEKFPVSGYTPTISVDADGCWTVDGVQILDASGNPIKATTDATSVFRSAELDGDGNFSLTLGDGSTITLRVFNSLNLKLDAMPVTTVADPSKSITVSYELSGEAKETAIVAVAKAEGLDAVIDRDAKTVTVSFDASFSRGTVIVMAYDLADNVIVKPLFYKAATLGTVAISTPDQLVAFAAAVNAGGEEAAAKAVLTQDIDMKDVAWIPDRKRRLYDGQRDDGTGVSGHLRRTGPYGQESEDRRSGRRCGGFGLGTLRRAEGRHGQEPCHRRRLVGRFDRGCDDGRGSRGRICL